MSYFGFSVAEGISLRLDYSKVIIKSPDNNDFIRVNVDGICNLIDARIKNGVKRMIYISSLEAGLEDINNYSKTMAIMAALRVYNFFKKIN